MIVLTVIVIAGLVLRLFLIEQWRPAFVGFPDSTIYIGDAHTGIFNNPLRVGGYAEFLRIMHGLRPHLSFAILVQHLLGLASGLLLFGAVRRAGFPSALGLAPAGVVILGGSELFVEHAPLSEAVFIFLVDLGLYAVIRTWRGSWVWGVVAGISLGAGADVRTVGLLLLGVTVIFSLLLAPGSFPRRLVRVGVAVLAAAIPIGSFLSAHERAVGYGGFTGAGYFDLYARVAPFADCSEFDPPPGTRRLCVTIPRSKRLGHDAWEFTTLSPAVRVYGEPDESVPRPGENAHLRAFAEAAVLGQPGEYLEAVGRDLIRIVDPSFKSSPYVGNLGYGNTPESLAAYYFDTSNEINVQRVIHEYYPADGNVHKSISFFRSYERDTRVEGPFMALLLLLSICAPLFNRGDQRRAALFFLTVTTTLLVAPILVSEYDYRFTIPAFGPLAATAALGGFGLARYGQTAVRRTRRLQSS